MGDPSVTLVKLDVYYGPWELERAIGKLGDLVLAAADTLVWLDLPVQV